MSRTALTAWLAAAAIGVWLVPIPRAGRTATPPPSDYDLDLARLERLIAAGGGDGGLRRLALVLAERAALTASPEHARLAETALDDALAHSRPSAELLLAKADLDLRLHRLPQARRDLAALLPLAPPAVLQPLRADIALQEGRYADARRACAEQLTQRRGWESLARLAQLESLDGDAAAADGLYAEAAEELTAKQMRALAWLEVQRGRLALGRGRFDEARGHYQRAQRAYSGYWLVEEHVAELLGAEGRFDEAVALYQRLAARSPRPELQQALGDLYAYMGQPDRAAPWHERALQAYLDSARRGEVQYLHHLASLYADVSGDGTEALKWARRDLELRRSVPALDGVAWALYRAGRFREARRVMDRALAPGLQDAHLFSRAGLIQIADGRAEAGRVLLARAAELNPSHASFHAHR